MATALRPGEKDAILRDVFQQALFRFSGLPEPEFTEPLPGAELPWRDWVTRYCYATCSAPFGERHVRLWDWFERLSPGIRTRPRVDIWPRGGAKALAVNTPIPTPNGWTTMGKLSVGDEVLDHRGMPTLVVGVSPVTIRTSYRVSFDDGTSIVASGDHLWLVMDKNSRISRPENADWATGIWDATDGKPVCEFPGCTFKTRKGRLCSAHAERKRTGSDKDVRFRHKSNPGAPRYAFLLTTEQILAQGLRNGNERTWAIPTARAFDGPKREYAVHPYVLGAWLGDGTTTAPNITCGRQDVDETQANIEACGVVVNRHTRQTAFCLALRETTAGLRSIGVLGFKHIPKEYLRGASEDRLELLRGLLDTDGTVSTHGSADLTTTKEILAKGVQELACSLGYRATVSETRATLRGKDCGPAWRVRVAGVGPEVFKLQRKQNTLLGRTKRQHKNTGRVRYIESIERIPDQPVRCIIVNSPGSLFLAGEGWVPTHNSSTAELCVARAAVRLSRRYCLYVSDTQAQADKHVGSIASLMEQIGIGRAVNVYGHSKGWRHSELRTANGFNVTAFGLDAGSRGVKLDQYRPDLIIFDDIDRLHDTDLTIEKKIGTITTTILPSGSSDAATLFLQNRMHRRSIFSQLADGKADFLHDREAVCEEPAVRGMKYEQYLDPDDGINRYRITGGEPTWEGQSLATCESQMNTWGLRAFLREAQHEVKAGDAYFFDISKIRIEDDPVIPAGAAQCRAWDLAATEGDGDWTSGPRLALWGKYPNVRGVFLDWKHGQWGSDKVRNTLTRTAEADGSGVRLRIPQDPGQAGKDQAEQLKVLLKKYNPIIKPVTGDKATRAQGLAEAINAGNIAFKRAYWNDDVLSVFEEFQEHCPPGQIDDAVDAAADAFNTLVHGVRSYEFT